MPAHEGPRARCPASPMQGKCSAAIIRQPRSSPTGITYPPPTNNCQEQLDPTSLMKASCRVWSLVFLVLASACSPHRGSGNGFGSSTPIDGARASAGGASDSLASDSLSAHGLDVYRSQYCGVCHEFRPAGSLGSSGPTHDGIGLIAARRVRDPKYTGNATTAEEYVRESIVAPTAYLVPGYEHTMYRMPAYTMLSESDLEALVQLLLRDN